MRLTAILRARGRFKYWDRYVERRTTHIHRERQWHPIAGWLEKDNKHFYYGRSRPWTDDGIMENMFIHQLHDGDPGKVRNVVKPIQKWNMFKGDRVMILVGKDKGKVGEIAAIIKERNWVFVNGLNLNYKMSSITSEPTVDATEDPLLATTQVSLVDPEDNEPTSIEWRYNEEGKRVRISTRTGRIIPLPEAYNAFPDGVIPAYYVFNQAKDTNGTVVKKNTYEPKLVTFEEDIMDSMGIKDDKKRKPTYWY